MIELKNINKTYISKSKRKVHVLRDLSLNLPDKGLIVIEGVSGAGKTTLLNILGGLDRNFQGEYYFLGKKLHSTKDFSNFRRDHVSLVFQDFNLIKDLTVAENISMGLQFSKNEGIEEIKDALSKVGLTGYEEKYPSECSGGEQQRIAIARTMLKASSMLIADEPTGNLDENTAREIFDILKEISKEKLVIVVTHDEDLGSEYADYMVYLKDGLAEHNLPETKTERHYEEKKLTPITNKIAFKMAWHEFTRKKIFAVVNTFLLLSCFLILSLTFSLLRTSFVDTQYRLIVDQGYEYVWYPYISGATLKKYEEQGTKIIHSNKNNLFFTSKQQAEDFGIRFYESDKTMELAPNVYYISDYCANQLILDRKVIVVDGKEVRLDPDIHTPIDLIGASCPILACNYNIKLFYSDDIASIPLTGVCGGLYYSNFDKDTKDDQISRYHSAWTMSYICYPQYCFNSKTDDFEITLDSKPMDSIYITSNIKDANNDYVACFVLKADNQIEWFDNVYDGKLLEGLKENETYIPLSTYNNLFQTNYSVENLVDFKVNDYDETTFTVVAKHYPKEMGKTLDINITNTITKDKLQIDSLKIKGVIGFVYDLSIRRDYHTGTQKVYYRQYNTSSDIFYSTDKNIYEQIMNMPNSNDSFAWIKVDSIKNLKSFVKTHYELSEKKVGGISILPTAHYVKDYQKTVSGISKIMVYFGIIFIVITIISLILTISMQVKGRTHELAVFKALGAQNRDLSKIYLFEMVTLSALTLPISILGAFVANTVINKLIAKGVDPRLSLWSYDFINIPITICFGVVLILVALIVPLIKISKLNVIDAIKIK